MLKHATLDYEGKRYELELDHGQTTETNAPTAGVRPMWRVTIGGTAVTSFEAEPGDTEDDARARLRDWLDHQPSLNDRDQIHLGGG